ncbi:succinylglutamate desuccinylase/aspartoacylase family protein [Isoalcanivorax indicus]|uniref:succinylglutamate desuccinylase/aspartoacylase family protein n=1 Tax=Isoalcanivorax indicus TaxID=2202653 RepID=UPI000DB995F2|nr:succinylglutamate desuccinylase/aspartoacylase family protein [Isoalcanivorax indicus]
MSASTFEFGGVSVAPGQRTIVEMPAAQLYTQTQLNIPVHVVHGRQAGPVLLVCAAIHGDELNGVEIIRRVLRLAALKRMRGTLIAVPVVNVFGFIHKSRYLPDRRDLNRCFPGSETGSLGARMAWLFKTQIMDRATHAVDLHTGAIYRSNLPQIRANLASPDTAAMAEAFGVPVVLNSVLRDGTLREVAEAQDIPVITYEAGEALRFEEASIRAGVRGVTNVMRHLGMLTERRTSPVPVKPAVSSSSTWVRAEVDGVFRTLVGLGDRVRKDQVLGRISSPFTADEVDILSPCAGILVGRNNLPLVNEGEALFHIARFDEVKQVAQQLEAFNNNLLDEVPAADHDAPIAP